MPEIKLSVKLSDDVEFHIFAHVKLEEFGNFSVLRSTTIDPMIMAIQKKIEGFISKTGETVAL